MKVKVVDRLYVLKLITGLPVMLFILAFSLNQLAWGAGTSSSGSSSKSESATQKRERANEYFEEGKKIQEKWRYKEAAKK